jgi:hypothetical protein
VIIPGGSQLPELISMIILSQLISPPPSRRIAGLLTRQPRTSHVLSLPRFNHRYSQARRAHLSLHWSSGWLRPGPFEVAAGDVFPVGVADLRVFQAG